MLWNILLEELVVSVEGGGVLVGVFGVWDLEGLLAIKELHVEETVDFDKGSELSIKAVLFCMSVVDEFE